MTSFVDHLDLILNETPFLCQFYFSGDNGKAETRRHGDAETRGRGEMKGNLKMHWLEEIKEVGKEFPIMVRTSGSALDF